MTETRTPSVRKLVAGLCRTDPDERWRSVRALGDWAAGTRERRPGKVRDLLRRLAWSLSEESGGTGWGAPEAMGEIVARVPEHRAEYATILLGYLWHEETFLENEHLDAGVLWAVGRLGPDPAFPEADLVRHLRRFLAEGGARTRGAAAWCAGRHRLSPLAGDLRVAPGSEEEVVLLADGEIVIRTVGELCREALDAMG